MAFETLDLGIELTLPTSGTTNWGATIKNTTWTKISAHTHTGGGNGAQLSGGSFLPNSLDEDNFSFNLGGAVGAELLPTGTTETIDFDTGNIQRLNLGSATGDVTLTLSNARDGGEYTIYVEQGATPRDLVWPASVKWPQGQAIITSETNGAVDVIKLQYVASEHRVMFWDLEIS